MGKTGNVEMTVFCLIKDGTRRLVSAFGGAYTLPYGTRAEL